jgi:RNA recognition motif-containing protein
MRISTASTQRKADTGQSAVIPPPPSLLDSDPANTTVFIGNLDNSVSPDQLRVYVIYPTPVLSILKLTR